MFGRKLKDYSAVWNAGVGFIYLLIGTFMGLIGFDSLHLHGNIQEMIDIVVQRFTSLSTWEIVVVVFFALMWLAGLLNFIYVRRYILEYKIKSFVGFAGTILLFIVNIIVTLEVFFDIQVNNNGLSLISREYLANANWIVWTGVGVVCFSTFTSLIGIVLMIKGAITGVVVETEVDKMEKKRREKEAKAREKERKKEARKKKNEMPIAPAASRMKIDESQMMFKSGDNNEEDEELAEEIAKNKPNPFIEKKPEESAKKEEPKDTNVNGVPNSVIKENPVLNSPVSFASPNISPNFESSEPEVSEPDKTNATPAAGQ